MNRCDHLQDLKIKKVWLTVTGREFLEKLNSPLLTILHVLAKLFDHKSSSPNVSWEAEAAPVWRQRCQTQQSSTLTGNARIIALRGNVYKCSIGWKKYTQKCSSKSPTLLKYKSIIKIYSLSSICFPHSLTVNKTSSVPHTSWTVICANLFDNKGWVGWDEELWGGIKLCSTAKNTAWWHEVRWMTWVTIGKNIFSESLQRTVFLQSY